MALPSGLALRKEIEALCFGDRNFLLSTPESPAGSVAALL